MIYKLLLGTALITLGTTLKVVGQRMTGKCVNEYFSLGRYERTYDPIYGQVRRAGNPGFNNYRWGLYNSTESTKVLDRMSRPRSRRRNNGK